MMDGAIKRALRIHKTKDEYYVALLNGMLFTTKNIDDALDFTAVDDNQVQFVLNDLFNKGYREAHLVTYGLQFVDEYGKERFYEKPFYRSFIDDLMELLDEEYSDLTREDE